MKGKYFRMLPAMDELLAEEEISHLRDEFPEQIIKDAATFVVNKYRNLILELKEEETLTLNNKTIIEETIQEVKNRYYYSLIPTLNGTGTVGHTNLGRAVLSKEALDHILETASSYNNLEYNLKKGKRGSRYDHVTNLLLQLTGAEDAVIVNNNAAAVFLILNTLAKGGESIVSRGELIEIGGSFRISSIMEESGSTLVEVGATNKAHLRDYEEAITEDTKCLLKVHTSNFAIQGFHEEVTIEELKELSEKYQIPIYEDLGSGTLLDFQKYGLSHERTVQETLKEGVDIVSFSGDKILGGPQAGIILGKTKYIEKIRKNQLLRAFRVDKLTLAGLEGTLRAYYDPEKAVEEIPMLKLMTLNQEEVHEKAIKLKEIILENSPELDLEIVETVSQVGGGAYPVEELPSASLSFTTPIPAHQFEEKLRLSDIHLIGMIHDGKYLLDLRCLFEEDFEKISQTIKEIR